MFCCFLFRVNPIIFRANLKSEGWLFICLCFKRAIVYIGEGFAQREFNNQKSKRSSRLTLQWASLLDLVKEIFSIT